MQKTSLAASLKSSVNLMLIIHWHWKRIQWAEVKLWDLSRSAEEYTNQRDRKNSKDPFTLENTEKTILKNFGNSELPSIDFYCKNTIKISYFASLRRKNQIQVLNNMMVNTLISGNRVGQF